MATTARDLELLLTKDFDRSRRALARKSGEGKRVARQVDAALFRWQKGEEPELKLTHHGESRLPHILKYDLQGYYRLIVYEHGGKRVPLYVGNHDDCDRWLDSHSGRDFTVDLRTGRLTYAAVPAVTQAPTRLEPAPPSSSGPVLGAVPSELIESLGLVEPTRQSLMSFVTFEEVGDERTLQLLTALAFPSETVRDAVIQSVVQITAGQLEEGIATLRLCTRDAVTATQDPDRFREAVDSGQTCDSLVSLSNLPEAELQRILSNHSFADWMLFLHPEQRKIVSRECNGPSRLLGVSGSGKTTVLVHRAVHLAKKHNGAPVLVVCLNASLRKLIDHLLDCLCPPEHRHAIATSTMYDYCYRVVKTVAPERLIERRDPRSGEDLIACWRDFLEKPHAMELIGCVVDALNSREDKVDASSYILDELVWIRSGFGRETRNEYLTCDRVGRGIPLPRMGAEGGQRSTAEAGMPPDTRRRMLQLLSEYEEYMAAGGLLDEDGVSLAAYSLRHEIDSRPELRARCVLVDEVQDCSTIELAVLSCAPTDSTDGLFLVGDPVQKVFPKQHDLVRAGIDIVGRGQLLRHNYRNTRQVLEAAFTLIRHFVLDSAIAPSEVIEPQYAFRDGSRPSLYECETKAQQVELVLSYLEHYDAAELDSVCVCSAVEETLVAFEQACSKKGLATVRLTGREDISKGTIKISTLEQVKGFEFEKVFILDLSDRVLPSRGLPFEERWRDAFRIYVAMTRARDELVMAYVYNRSILLGPVHDTVVDLNARSWLGQS